MRYHEMFTRRATVFVEHYGAICSSAFRQFQDAGVLEIITCGATHGFLPLMLGNRNWLARAGA